MTAVAEHALLKPTTRQNVIDVLNQARYDTSDWADFKGRHPATNPKAYQWAFEQPGEFVVLFLWHSGIIIAGDKLTYRIAPRKPTGLNPWSEAKWKASSNKFVGMVRAAYEQQLPIRAVIVDGKQFDAKTNPNASKVEFRRLDEMPWAVQAFDANTMEGVLVRDASPVHPNVSSVDNELTAFEGWKRRAFIWHRHRESELRRAKIKETMDKNGGRLICEVPRCKFDFGKRYGALGQGYAHVHHLEPLSKTPKGRTVALKDLAVVCANCHAMVHIGGQCRDIATLIPESTLPA